MLFLFEKNSTIWLPKHIHYMINNNVILWIVGIGGDGLIQESGSGSSRPSEGDVKELTVALTDWDIFVWLTLVRKSRSETTEIFIQPDLRSRKRHIILPNTRRWSNVGSMLGYRLRRWLSIKPTLNQLLLFTGMHVPCMAVSRFVTITVLYSHY